MARDDCYWCCGIQELARNEVTWRTAVQYILCDIRSALTPSGETTRTALPLVTIAYTSLTNALVATGFVDAEKKVLNFTVENLTDGDIALGPSNTETSWVVPANSIREFDFGSVPLVVTTDIYIKYLGTPLNPTQGTVYIEGYY